MYNILSKTKKKKIIISMKLSLVSFRYMYVLKSRQVAVPKFMYVPFVSVHFFRSTGSSAGFFPDKTWSISPRYKKSLKVYLLTAVRTNLTISPVRIVFRRMKLIHQEVESFEILFILLFSYVHF